MKYIATILLLTSIALGMTAQRQIHLDLQTTIKMASDSSLSAFRNKNMYLVNYWTYRGYRAERLPSLSLSLQPANYNRTLVSRYDSNSDRDIYRQQKSFSAYGALSLTQNFDPLGGQFYVQTSIDFLRYFGASTFNQYSAVPVIVGYRHNIAGYNEFKWDRRIEPMKLKKATLEFLYDSESIAKTSVQYFFALAQAQTQYAMAIEQKASCDSLLVIGERRYKIASISKSDLLSLRLDVVNAANSITQAEVLVKRATLNLASFLGIDRNTPIILDLPGAPANFDIETEKALEMMHANSYMIVAKTQSIVEAERDYDQVRKTTRFNASINASMGFNQQAEKIGDAYHDPMRKDVVSVGISIPIIDWGTGRGKRNIAQNNLNIARIDAEQKTMELEQTLLITIGELQSRRELMKSAETALVLADEVYNETKLRFRNGNCDIATLNQAQQRLLSAQNGYIQSMSDCWTCYYDLRQQTLYDYEMGMPLSESFDFTNIVSGK